MVIYMSYIGAITWVWLISYSSLLNFCKVCSVVEHCLNDSEGVHYANDLIVHNTYCQWWCDFCLTVSFISYQMESITFIELLVLEQVFRLLNIIYHIKPNFLLDIYFISVCLLQLLYFYFMLLRMDFSKQELSIILLHEFKLWHSRIEATSKIIKAWGTKCVSDRTDLRWFEKFCVGEIGLGDKEGCDRP